MTTMRAVLAKGKGGIEVLQDEEKQAKPELRPTDVLIKVLAAAVNPVDSKNRAEDITSMGDRILGYDGCGEVIERGAEAADHIKVGDVVMFAGDISRNGSYAELLAVDSRIVAHKPKKLDVTDSAALPLVFITVWELLFENLRLPTDGSCKDMVFLMINGAGGVGSAAIQIAKHVLGCETIIATASRPESEAWCRKMGATHVINHHNNFAEELKRVGAPNPDISFVGVDLSKCYDQVVEVTNAAGYIGAINVTESSKVDVAKLFGPKRLTLSFEFMFTRPMLANKPRQQGQLLARVAALIDEGKFQSITGTRLKGLSAETFKEAQTLQDSGKQIGKIAVEY